MGESWTKGWPITTKSVNPQADARILPIATGKQSLKLALLRWMFIGYDY